MNVDSLTRLETRVENYLRAVLLALPMCLYAIVWTILIRANNWQKVGFWREFFVVIGGMLVGFGLVFGIAYQAMVWSVLYELNLVIGIPLIGLLLLATIVLLVGHRKGAIGN